MNYKRQSYLALIPFLGFLVVLFMGFIKIKENKSMFKALTYVFLSFILVMLSLVIIVVFPMKWFYSLQIENSLFIVVGIIFYYFGFLIPTILMISIQKLYLQDL